jgi:hypothetical protein
MKKPHGQTYLPSETRMGKVREPSRLKSQCGYFGADNREDVLIQPEFISSVKVATNSALVCDSEVLLP